MKTCNVCNTTKYKMEFHVNSASPDGIDSRCKLCKKEIYLNKKKSDPLSTYYVAKRSWCKQRGIEFSLTLKQLKEIWTGKCPILGLEITIGESGKGSHNSAHLDRLDPSIGYVYDNVNWISGRANRIKYNATIDELKAIVQWVERVTTIPKGSTPK